MSRLDGSDAARAYRASLKKELQLLEVVLFKHNNQHRRTLYFRSLKSICRLLRRTLSSTKDLCVQALARC